MHIGQCSLEVLGQRKLRSSLSVRGGQVSFPCVCCALPGCNTEEEKVACKSSEP